MSLECESIEEHRTRYKQMQISHGCGNKTYNDGYKETFPSSNLTFGTLVVPLFLTV